MDFGTFSMVKLSILSSFFPIPNRHDIQIDVRSFTFTETLEKHANQKILIML